jgi:tetratricopeptide (TPR) repeat protein
MLKDCRSRCEPTPKRETGMAKLLSVLLVSVACAALLSACGTAESRKQHAIEKGDHYLAAGNLDKAFVEFRNALQLAPNDAVARFKNGTVLERRGSFREAATFYKGAIDINADYVAAQAALSRLFVLGGAPARALEVLGPALERHPSEPVLLAERAAARALLNEKEAALADAERAYQLAPTDETTIGVLAGLYGANGNGDRAERVLKDGIRAAPRNVDFRLELAQFYGARGQNAPIEPLLREIIALQPDDPVHRVRLAAFLSTQDKDAAAETVYREAIAAAPNDRRLPAALVDFLARKRGRASAEAELRHEIDSAARDDFEPRFALAQFYQAGGESAKAEAVYRDVIKQEGTHGPGLAARDRLAATLAVSGHTADAARLAGEVLEASPHDADALILRGNLELARGDAKDAIVDLRGALRDQPNSVGILRVLARAHLANGEDALAEETARRAVDAAPGDVQARLELAELLARAGKPEQAKQILAMLAKDRPADTTVQRAMFVASFASKDYVAAAAAADALTSAEPKSYLGHFLRGGLLEAQSKTAEAVAEYDHALELAPTEVEPLEAVTQLLARNQRQGDAFRRLDTLAAAQPTYALPLVLKGRLLSAARRYPDADGAFVAATNRAPDWWVPYKDRAHLMVERGNTDGAVGLLRDALSKVKVPDPLKVELAGIEERRGNTNAALVAYEELHTAHPGDVAIANNLAMLLVTARADAASLARAGELVTTFQTSANPRLLDTFGWVKLKQGDAPAALAALERAGQGETTAPEVRYHLGMAELAAGQKERAAGSLKAALATGTTFPGHDDAVAALRRLGTGS